MAFRFKDNLLGNGGRVLIPFTITDSQVISVGEAVKLASGKVSTWGAGGLGLGIVEAIRNADGSVPSTNGAGGDFHGTYTAGSSNTVQAIVDVSKWSRYSVTADATLGTTTGSNLAGYNIDTDATSLVLAESSAVSTTGSFFIWGVDPDTAAPANSVIVSVQESQMDI